jgi:hypothetical protein
MATIHLVPTGDRMSPAGADGLGLRESHITVAVPPALLLTIRETHRQRQDLLRAELRLTNQIEAIHRRLTGLTKEQRRRPKIADNGAGHVVADAQVQAAGAEPDGGDLSPRGTQSTRVAAAAAGGEGQRSVGTLDVSALPAGMAALYLLDVRDQLAAHRKPFEKRLEKLAKQLPVYPWAASVRGLGALSLAQIVAETGDLSLYANPAKVWKRMGLAVMPDGKRQRRVPGDEAFEHGYSPQRRSLMYVVGENLVKLNRDGPYRTYYLAEKERQRAKLPDAPLAHPHNRAMRHMTKRLLRDLWRAWRDRVEAGRRGGYVPPPATGPREAS